MAYEITMVKLVSGETVLGKLGQDNNSITDPAVLQTVPTQQGVQMMLMPYGYPFDMEFSGSIALSHVVYVYNNVPEDLKTKYMEACSNLSLSSGGLSNLNLTGEAANSNISSLLRGK